MRSAISIDLIARVKPGPKPYEIRDSRLRGFLVRVQPSGVITYYIEFARGRRMAIGRTDAVTPALAREKAKSVLADAYQGVDPTAAKRLAKALMFRSFIEETYALWAEANIRSADATVARLKASFSEFLTKKLGEITPWHIEKWRAARLKSGRKPSTVNRDLDDLRSSLNKAVSWGLLEVNPVISVKRCRIDPSLHVRFLAEEEETRLRIALKTRDDRIKLARQHANQWRQDRDYPLLPDLIARTFADYLHPMVLVSLNTGLRRGELFSLVWEDADLERSNLTVRGSNAKSGKTRHIPLNDEARLVLTAWHHDSAKESGPIFIGKKQELFNNVRKSWLAVLDHAHIQRFRWHDLRHSFASHLVMAGVDLNTVRELLGHSDYKMTLRYAHLAPAHKAAAVAKLVRAESALSLSDPSLVPASPIKDAV